MTYIIGWKTKDTVFVSGDTALTFPTDVQGLNFTGVLDRVSGPTKVKLVGGAKVKILNQKLIVAYTGYRDPAMEFMSYLRKLLLRSPNYDFQFVRDCITGAVANSPMSDNKYIFAFMEKDLPLLASYDYQTGMYLHENFVHFGSLKNSKWHQKEMEVLLTSASTGQAFVGAEFLLSDDDKMIVVNSIVRSVLLMRPLVHEGVGGVFFGMRVDKAGVHWQPDVVQITHDQKFQNCSRCSMFFSKGVVFIQGTDSHITAMGDGNYNLDGITDEQTIDKIRDNRVLELFDEHKPKHYPYYIFMSTDVPYSVILRRDLLIGESAFAKFEDPNNYHSKIGVTHWFKEFLSDDQLHRNFKKDDEFIPAFDIIADEEYSAFVARYNDYKEN